MATDTTTRIYELQVKLATESLAQLKKLQAETKAAETRFAALSDRVKNFGVGLIAAFSVGAIVAAVNQAIQAVDELGAAAQRVGLPVEEFSALAFAAEQSDMAMADLEIGLKELAKSMVEVGTKGADVLDALQIDKTKPQVEVLKDFAEAFKTIQDPALRTNALLEVFGKSGLKLRPLLEQGAIGIDELMKKARELGLIVSEETAKGLSDLDNEVKITKKSAELLTREMTVALAPALTDVMRAFQGATKEGDAFNTLGTVLGFTLRAVAGSLVTIVQMFKQVGVVVHGVGTALWEMFIGERTEAAETMRVMNLRLAENTESFSREMEMIAGATEATTAATAATTKNTQATKNNDAAVKAALAGRKEEKDSISAFGKMVEALNDQLARMASVTSETVELDKALRRVAEVLMLLSPVEQAHAMILLAEVAATEKANKATKDRKTALDELDGILKGLRTDEQKFNDELHRLQELMEKFPERTEEIMAAQQELWKRWIESQKKVNETATDSDKLLATLADKIDGYAKSMAGSFVDFATGAQDAKFSFSDFVASVLRDILKMLTQMMIVEPLIASLRTSMGIGAKPNALGGVYTSRSLSAYSGGVYDSPQLFSFASGAGVFAEAGPEAIMPLARGPDGKLGVQASGSGGDVTVNVINQTSAQVGVDSQRNSNGEREITVLIQRAVMDGFARGRFDSLLGATYGVSRRGH